MSVHARLSARFVPNRTNSGRCASSPPFRRTENIEAAMSPYTTVDTGPKTGPGGCHDGLSSRRYQRLLSAGVVARAPKPAVGSRDLSQPVGHSNRTTDRGARIRTGDLRHPKPVQSRRLALDGAAEDGWFRSTRFIDGRLVLRWSCTSSWSCTGPAV